MNNQSNVKMLQTRHDSVPDDSSALDIMPKDNLAQPLLTCTDSGTSETTQSLQSHQSHESSPLYDRAENYADVAKCAAEVGDDEG